MYAIVKFVDETTTRIVHVSDIKHFNHNVMDKQKFLVKFTDGNFYPAQVVIVKETLDELEEFNKKKRLRFKNTSHLESAAETSESDSSFSCKGTDQKTELKKTEKEKAFNNKLQITKFKKHKEEDIFKKFDALNNSKSSTSDVNKPVLRYESKYGTVHESSEKQKDELTLKKKLNIIDNKQIKSVPIYNEDHNESSSQRQKDESTFKKPNNIFNNQDKSGSDKSDLSEADDDDSSSNSDCKGCKSLMKELKAIKLQYQEMVDMNMELQRKVIGHFKAFKGKQVLPNKDEENVVVGSVVGDQVHLGKSVFLSKSCYDDAWFRSTSCAHFVKTIAFYLFGNNTLINSSVTGKKGNRGNTCQKPPLDPTKLAAIEEIYKYYLKEKHPDKDIKHETKMIKVYIAGKISDLVRAEERRKKAKKNEEKNADLEEDLNLSDVNLESDNEEKSKS